MAVLPTHVPYLFLYHANSMCHGSYIYSCTSCLVDEMMAPQRVQTYTKTWHYVCPGGPYGPETFSIYSCSREIMAKTVVVSINLPVQYTAEKTLQWSSATAMYGVIDSQQAHDSTIKCH